MQNLFIRRELEGYQRLDQSRGKWISVGGRLVDVKESDLNLSLFYADEWAFIDGDPNRPDRFHLVNSVAISDPAERWEILGPFIQEKRPDHRPEPSYFATMKRELQGQYMGLLLENGPDSPIEFQL